ICNTEDFELRLTAIKFSQGMRLFIRRNRVLESECRSLRADVAMFATAPVSIASDTTCSGSVFFKHNKKSHTLQLGCLSIPDIQPFSAIIIMGGRISNATWNTSRSEPSSFTNLPRLFPAAN